MIAGYFCLGGSNNPPFQAELSGNHLGSRDRGHWGITSDLESTTLNIPSRDKQVQVWYPDTDSGVFLYLMSNLDSSHENKTYREKLDRVADALQKDFIGFINNINVDTHGSLALVSNQDLHLYGIQDSSNQACYLVWSDELEFIQDILNKSPLKYLIYRFPMTSRFFLPSEAICSKWFRWLKNNSVLHAFNALERRICGAQET